MRSTGESLRKELAEVKEALKAEEDARVASQREAAALRERGEELARTHEDLSHRYQEKEALESIQQEDVAKKTAQVDLAAKRLVEQEEEMERRERQLNTRELEVHCTFQTSAITTHTHTYSTRRRGSRSRSARPCCRRWSAA